MKILVVDDKEENRYLLETLFKGSGYDVVTTANGRDALAILHAEKIDLIVSDCLMPVMDGFELCRQCKADATLKNIPFIFCTASYPDKKDEEFALELGAAEYIIKPFEPDNFIKTVKDVIAKAEKGQISKIKPALADNALFKLYNERLTNKLAQKVAELSAENERCNEIEKELRISENNFRNSMDDSPLGIRIVSEDGETSYTNRAFLDIYGYKDVEEFNATLVKDRYTPESYTEFNERRGKRRRREPLPDNYEVSIIRKDGMVRQLQVIRKGILWGGKQQYQTIYEDITERKQAEAALKNSEEFLNNVIEKTPNAMWVSDEKGTIIRMNQALRDLLKIKDEEIIDKYNVLKDSQVIEQGYLPLVKSVFEEGKTIGFTLDYSTSKEQQVTLKEPTHKVLEIVISAVRNEKGKVIHAIAQENDITARNQMTVRINELNNILQLVSDINQLIVEIDNEEELLKKACELFVESRQYMLVWIGFKKEGSYEIKPSIWAGKGTEYVASAKITWDDSQFGQGPTGTAIRTGKPCVMRDILNEPKYQAWREQTVKIGFKSSLAQPLIIHDKVIGVLNIYSASVDAFDTQELDLLSELAGDLSLGIEKIRQREERLKMEEVLRDSEHRLREAQEMAHLGFWNWDVKTGDVKWSEEVFKIFHLDSETFTPHIDSILALSPWPEDHRRDQELINRAAESHSPGSYEQKFLRPDGSIGYYYSTFQGKYDAKNNLISIVGTVLDITERKRAEEALTASEVSYRRLFESAKDGILIIDANTGLITDANPFLNDLLGLSLSEIKGRKLWEIGTFSDIISSKMRFQELQQKGYMRYEDLPLKTTDGRQISVEFVSNVYDVDHRRVIQCNIRDITARKRAEEEKEKAHNLLREAEIIGKAGGWEFNIDTGQQVWTEETARIHEVEPEFKPNVENGISFYTPACRALVSQAVQRVIDHGESFDLELEIITAKGNRRNVRAIGHPDLEHRRVYGFFQDITEQKRAEEALKESEAKYRLIVEKSNDIVFTFNPAGEFLYVSPSVKKILGYNPTDLIGRTFGSLVHPEDMPGLQQAIQRNIKDGSQTPGGNRYRIRHASGEWRWHNAAGNAAHDANGKYLCFIGISRDITEQKHDEEALQASEQNFRNSIDASLMGIHIVDKDWHTLYANRAFLDIYGYENIEELKASRQEDRYTPESYASWVERHEKMLRGEPVPDEIEADIIRKDGTIRHIQSFRREILWDGKQQYQLLYNDITERKRAEEALQESETRYHELVNNITSGVIIYRAVDNGEDFVFVDINSAAEKLEGINRKEIIGKKITEVLPGSRDYNLFKIFQKVWQTGNSEYYSSSWRQDESDPGKWRDNWAYQLPSGEIVNVYDDITDKKLSEEALKESEERYRLIVENTQDIILTENSAGDVIYITPAIRNILGYNQADIIGHSFRSLIHPEDKVALEKAIQRNIKDGYHNPGGSEFRVRHASGEWRWYNGRATVVRDTNGNFISLVAIAYDITERKQIEEALKASEEKYSTLIEQSGDGIVILDVHTIKFANRRINEVSGFSQDEILDKMFIDLVAPEFKEITAQSYDRELSTGMPNILELEMLTKDGRRIPVDTRALPIIYQGKPATMVTIRDITKRKQAEEALKASEQNFRNSMDSSFIGININDTDFHTLYANQAFLDIFGYANIEELEASPPYKYYTPESYADFLLRVEKQKDGVPIPDKVEIDIVRKDGVIRHLQLFRKEVLWDGKQQYQILYDDITERKLAEEALKASEQNFHNSLDSSLMGINIVDKEWNTLYANQVFLDIFGYKNIDEVRTSALQDHYTPEEYARYLLRKEKRLRGEVVPDNLKVDIIGKDGIIRHLEVFSSGVFWNGKQQRQLIYNDVTERIRAEEALKASENSFRNSLDNSPIGIRISDRNDDTLYANQAFLNIFGYESLEELKVSPPLKHYTPAAYADFLQRMENQRGGAPRPDSTEIEIIRKDGNIRNLRLFTRELVWYGKQQFQNLYYDTTERMRAEEALKASEEKYRLIVENTRDIIFTVNAHEEYVYVSPSVKGILGYNQADLIGKPFISLVHPEDRHIIEEETEQATVPGYQVSGDNEYRIRHASGDWHWVVSRGTRVMDPIGKIIYFTGVIRDITESKRAEKEKQILEEKAQVASRLAAVGEMAAGIAHEINNPLTGVLGFSQMLLENKNVPEDIKENLALIVDGSQRVAEIVKRLLTFARQAKPIKAVANLNELIDNTLKLREYVLKTNSINVVTMFDPELPWSVVDPGQMQQVFLNLIVNAEQAMKKSHGKGTLTITSEKKENNIHISFQDDGPGITKENMGHLFEPFFTTKDPGEGTGLGLSLSRSIILEHNGKMSVESEFGHGATFIVELPIIEALPPEVETTTLIVKEEKTITKQGRILVVDDEAGVRTLLEKALTRAGHSVDVIDDARAALDIIDAGTIYDVIVMDVRMPGMSGIELYPLIIRKMPLMKNRIIFITGDVMGLDIKTFLNQNDLPYLAKPFDIELLKAKIDTILGAGQT